MSRSEVSQGSYFSFNPLSLYESSRNLKENYTVKEFVKSQINGTGGIDPKDLLSGIVQFLNSQKEEQLAFFKEVVGVFFELSEDEKVKEIITNFIQETFQKGNFKVLMVFSEAGFDLSQFVSKEQVARIKNVDLVSFAVAQKDVDKMRFLIEIGEDVDGNALSAAVETANIAAVRNLLSSGADLDMSFARKLLATNSHPRLKNLLLQELMNFGANGYFDSSDENLFVPIAHKNFLNQDADSALNLLKILFDNQVDLSNVDLRDRIIKYALEAQRFQVAISLLANGWKAGRNVAGYVGGEGDIYFLKAFRALESKVYRDSELNALHYIAKFGDLKTFKECYFKMKNSPSFDLNFKAEIDVGAGEMTALAIALREQKFEIAEFIIKELNIDIDKLLVDFVGKEVDSDPSIEVDNDLKVKICQFLTEIKADFTKKIGENDCAFVAGVKNNQIDVVSHFVKNTPQDKLKEGLGKEAIKLAIASDFDEILKILFANGVNSADFVDERWSSSDKISEVISNFSSLENFKDTLNFIVKKGNLDGLDYFLKSTKNNSENFIEAVNEAANLSVENGNFEMVERLFNHYGADINFKKENFAPSLFDQALKKGFYKIAQFLSKNNAHDVKKFDKWLKGNFIKNLDISDHDFVKEYFSKTSERIILRKLSFLSIKQPNSTDFIKVFKFALDELLKRGSVEVNLEKIFFYVVQANNIELLKELQDFYPDIFAKNNDQNKFSLLYFALKNNASNLTDYLLESDLFASKKDLSDEKISLKHFQFLLERRQDLSVEDLACVSQYQISPLKDQEIENSKKLTEILNLLYKDVSIKDAKEIAKKIIDKKSWLNLATFLTFFSFSDRDLRELKKFSDPSGNNPNKAKILINSYLNQKSDNFNKEILLYCKSDDRLQYFLDSIELTQDEIDDYFQATCLLNNLAAAKYFVKKVKFKDESKNTELLNTFKDSFVNICSDTLKLLIFHVFPDISFSNEGGVSSQLNLLQNILNSDKSNLLKAQTICMLLENSKIDDQVKAELKNPDSFLSKNQYFAEIINKYTAPEEQRYSRPNAQFDVVEFANGPKAIKFFKGKLQDMSEFEMVNFLSQKKDGKTVLEFAMKSERFNLIYNILNSLPENFKQEDFKRILPSFNLKNLEQIISNSDFELLKKLILINPELKNIKGKNGESLIHLTVSSAQGYFCARSLLKNNLISDVDAVDNDGNSALHYACDRNYITHEFVDILLCYGANLKKLNKNNKTPEELIFEDDLKTFAINKFKENIFDEGFVIHGPIDVFEAKIKEDPKVRINWNETQDNRGLFYFAVKHENYEVLEYIFNHKDLNIDILKEDLEFLESENLNEEQSEKLQEYKSKLPTLSQKNEANKGLEKAAIIIQSNLKAFIERKRFNELRQAAIKIQSKFRQNQASEKFLNKKNEELEAKKNDSATILQSVARGFLSRTEIEKNNSAKNLQKTARGFLSRKNPSPQNIVNFILNQDFENAKNLIEKMDLSKINQKIGDFEQTILNFAIQKKAPIGFIEFLLQKGCDVNHEFKTQKDNIDVQSLKNALHQALQDENKELAELLIKNGAKTRHFNVLIGFEEGAKNQKIGDILMEIAFKNDNAVIFLDLIAQGYECQNEKLNEKLVQEAINNKNYKILAKAIKFMPNINLLEFFDKENSEHKKIIQSSEKLIHEIFARKIDEYKKTNESDVKKEIIQEIKELVTLNPKLTDTIIDPEGSFFAFTIYHQEKELLSLLNIPKERLFNENGVNLFKEAFMIHNSDFVKFLIMEFKVSYNEFCDNSEFLELPASQRRYLFNKKAGILLDKELKYKDGDTNLFAASFYQQGDIAKVLIESGADIFAIDNFGQNPIDICLSTLNNPVVKIIVEKSKSMGSDLKHKTCGLSDEFEGITILEKILKKAKNQKEIISEIIKSGIDFSDLRQIKVSNEYKDLLNGFEIDFQNNIPSQEISNANSAPVNQSEMSSRNRN
jgi:hypothetical protein